MTVLVLGGGGFIGRAVVETLHAAGVSLRVLDRNVAAGALAVRCAGLDWRVGVLADREALLAALQDIDAVVHLASPSSPAIAEMDWKADVDAHVVDSIRLIECMTTAAVRRLIFMSSGGTVYGDHHDVPIDEDRATQPICTYGINKLAVEHFIKHSQQVGRIDAVILRAANAYGPRQSTDRNQGLIGTSIVRVLAGEPLRVWGDGQVVRDFVYVEDIARAVLAAIDYRGEFTVFNIGSGIGRTVHDVIAAIGNIAQLPVRVEHLPARGLDVRFNVLDCSRARGELGWQPQTSFEQGLAMTLAWYRAQR
jgi:UDP-glucose 4-epimerase